MTEQKVQKTQFRNVYRVYTFHPSTNTESILTCVPSGIFGFPILLCFKKKQSNSISRKKKHMNQTLNLERQVSYTTGQFNKFINNQYICRILSLPRKLYGLWTQCSPVIARLKFSLPYFFLVQNKNRNN